MAWLIVKSRGPQLASGVAAKRYLTSRARFPKIACLILTFLLSAGCGSFQKKKKEDGHRVHLSWQAPGSAKQGTIDGYNIYRSTTPGGPYVLLASHTVGLIYDDHLVNSGTTYYYVVTSIDRGRRESKYSAEIKAVVP